MRKSGNSNYDSVSSDFFVESDEFQSDNNSNSDDDEFQDSHSEDPNDDYEYYVKKRDRSSRSGDRRPGERGRRKKNLQNDKSSSETDEDFHLVISKNSNFTSLASRREKRMTKSVSLVDDLPQEDLNDLKENDDNPDTNDMLDAPQLPSVERIIGYDVEHQLYYVKMTKFPECESSYLSADEIQKYPVGKSHLDSFNKEIEMYGSKNSIFIPFFIIPANWEEDEDRAIDRVIAYDEEHDLYLVKWQDSDYDQASWVRNPEAEAVAQFNQRQQRHNNNIRRMIYIPYIIPRSQDHSETSNAVTEDEQSEVKEQSQINEQKGISTENSNEQQSETNQNDLTLQQNENQSINEEEDLSIGEKRRPKFLPPPTYKNGNTLRSYQVEALNWMRAGYCAKSNQILADEMGLGKTIMCISMLHEVVTHTGIRGPFLIVAPLGTLPNWQREFNEWTNMNCIYFHGSSQSREVIKLYELFYPPPYDNTLKAQVVLTNMETVLKEIELIRSIKWHFVIIDEAHKLKNMQAKQYKMMYSLSMEHILLMTGTPIQNNLDEIFALLHFIEPKKFPQLLPFREKYHNIQTAEDVHALQETLKGYMLRRKKCDVDCSIASKEETIVEVELTRPQKLYYRMLLDSKRSDLEGKSTPKISALNNLAMQLRKVCNHPFLLQGAEESIIKPNENRLEVLISASGKMVFVDKLLRKLEATKQKVLIFSQMVRVLNLLEEFLNYRGYTYVRLDGRITGDERQIAIDHFNDPSGGVFVFLLCTKAGGVGLNLTAATNVIIYDSDWNPQNDVQAQSRCHRIGQTHDVKVYRLITRGTYESEMFTRASMKLGLDQAILDSNPSGGDSMSTKEIEVLIKKGAYHVYNDDDKETDQFVTEDIDEILKHRSKTVTEDGRTTNSLFSTASFVISGTGEQIDVNDVNFWEKVDPRSSEERLKEDRSFSLDENDEDRTRWNAVKRDRLLNSLISFGWGSWPIISSNLRPATDAAVEDAAHVCLTIIAQNVNDPISFVKAITNQDSIPLTIHQRRMLNSDPFGQKSWHNIIASKASFYEHRLLILQAVRSFLHSNHVSLNSPFPDTEEIKKLHSTKPKTYPIPDWSADDDLLLMIAVLRHGFTSNGIQTALTDGILKDIRSRVSDKRIKPFLSRFSILGEAILEDSRETEHTSCPSLRKEDPSIVREWISTLIDSGGLIDSIPTGAEVLMGALKISQALNARGESQKLREYIKAYCPDLVRFCSLFSSSAAERAVGNAEWLSRFREFATMGLPEHMEAAAVPEWWTEEMTTAVFKKLIERGFGGVGEMLEKPPFEGIVPKEGVEYANEFEARRRKSGSTRNPKGELAFLLTEKETEMWVEEVLEMAGGWPKNVPRRVMVPEWAAKMELPLVEDFVVVESLGGGEFGISRSGGFLYRVGFRAKSSFSRQRFICEINEKGVFTVQRGKNSVSGSDLEEVWRETGAELIDCIPEKMFGIGGRIVQYQYNAMYVQEGKAMEEYIQPKFEMFDVPKPKPKENIKKLKKDRKKKSKRRNDWEDDDEDEDDIDETDGDDDYD